MTNLYIVLEILMVFVCHIHGLSLTAVLPEDRGKLVFATILYRHGERNPDGFYTNDPYKHPSNWPEGLGTLTTKGKIQHYHLGKWLRKRYDSLIPGGKYSQDILHVHSTDVDRTIMSALANLAGMFYPTNDEVWEELRWQPIPVHTTPMYLDKMLLILLHSCPRIVQEDKTFRESRAMKEHNEKQENLYSYLTEHTGDLVRDPNKVRSIFTTLFIESQTLKNFTIPGWATKIYPDELEEVGILGLKMLTMTKTLKRLRGGPLLKEIIQHMKEKRDGTLTKNIWIYSGHDITVTCLLDTMGVFQPHMPPFAATVLVELRKNKQEEFLVSVYYKNSTGQPHLLTIPGCHPSCPLNIFEELLSDVIPDDWERECQDLAPIVPSTNKM